MLACKLSLYFIATLFHNWHFCHESTAGNRGSLNAFVEWCLHAGTTNKDMPQTALKLLKKMKFSDTKRALKRDFSGSRNCSKL